MARTGLTVHFERRPGSSDYQARGKGTTCRDGYLLLEGTLLADRSRPCPACNSVEATAAAAKRAEKAAWEQVLKVLCPPRVEWRPSGEPKVPTRVNRSDADLREIDTTGFTVIAVPEGVVPRRNREGNLVRRGGQVVMDTIDFRSDEAVARRMAGGTSKWGKGNVTGSTSVSSTWAVPARPGSDRFANSDDVISDLRSANTQNLRARDRRTPRKGAHRKPKTVVVRRYLV